jgi:hypothetical protein
MEAGEMVLSAPDPGLTTLPSLTAIWLIIPSIVSGCIGQLDFRPLELRLGDETSSRACWDCHPADSLFRVGRGPLWGGRV